MAVLGDRGRARRPRLLGLLAIRAAYLPLDTRAPAARSAAVADRRRRAPVLADPRHVGPARTRSPRRPDGALDVVALARRVRPEPAPVACPRRRADDLAYVIYTSGSTGPPKGAMVPPPRDEQPPAGQGRGPRADRCGHAGAERAADVRRVAVADARPAGRRRPGAGRQRRPGRRPARPVPARRREAATVLEVVPSRAAGRAGRLGRRAAPAPGCRRCAGWWSPARTLPGRAVPPLVRPVPRRSDGQRLRADRVLRRRDARLPHRRGRRRGPGRRADRPADPQHPPLRARRRAGPGAGRGARRPVRRRGGGRPRLPGRPRQDRAHASCPIRSAARHPHVPHRRPGAATAPTARWSSSAGATPGQDPRPAHRAGRGRGRAVERCRSRPTAVAVVRGSRGPSSGWSATWWRPRTRSSPARTSAADLAALLPEHLVPVGRAGPATRSR